LPVYERLGNAREAAVTKGRIADILRIRGDLDGALRIRREEELPVYERLRRNQRGGGEQWGRSPTFWRSGAISTAQWKGVASYCWSSNVSAMRVSFS
jgi:hypothetical protein